MRHKSRSQPDHAATAPVKRERSVPRADVRDTINGLFGGIGLALFGTRFFVPAEAAHLGDTLWIVQLWLLAAAVWWLLSLRHAGLAIRPDWGDGAVWLLAGGHVLSALLVVATAGQQRAAVNMAWEWIGVAVAVTMLRQWLRTDRAWRRLYHFIAVAGVVLSGLGVWQYAVWYPEYRGLMQELIKLEAAETDGGLSQAEYSRWRELRSELGVLSSERDPVARAVIRQRLLASTEPIGRFALANTLGGLLAACIVLLLGMGAQIRREPRSRFRLVRAAIGLILTSYCLMLTKSRTAWVGLLAGVGVWVSGVRAAGTREELRRPWRAVGAAALLLALIAAAGWWSGALDRLVIAETPKSLRYRLEYWSGTWGVIREAPLFGVGGAGNFRQHYLRHKLAGSSEEILDPHNLVLDVWANGGVIGLAGLLAVLWWFVRRVIPARQLMLKVGSPAVNASGPAATRGGAGFIGACSLSLVFLQQWGLAADVDTQVLWLLVGWIAASLLVPVVSPQPAAVTAAAAALLVHLLGAGGIAMPAINILLLLLLLGPSSRLPRGNAVGTGDALDAPPGLPYLLRLAAVVLLAIGGMLAPAIPVSLSRTYVAAGEAELTQRGDTAAARRYFEQAARIDPLDPQPWHNLAQLDYAQSLTSSGGNEEAFSKAMTNLSAAIARDPYAPKLEWLAAEWNLQDFTRSTSERSLQEAVAHAERAAAGYPHHSGIRATLAEACAAAGRSADAAREAQQALQLDQLNRDLAHYDRLLDDATIERLQGISQPGGAPGTGAP